MAAIIAAKSAFRSRTFSTPTPVFANHDPLISAERNCIASLLFLFTNRSGCKEVENVDPSESQHQQNH
jgi:hypothetical protein